jgi:hypothetical protein
VVLVAEEAAEGRVRVALEEAGRQEGEAVPNAGAMEDHRRGIDGVTDKDFLDPVFHLC